MYSTQLTILKLIIILILVNFVLHVTIFMVLNISPMVFSWAPRWFERKEIYVESVDKHWLLFQQSQIWPIHYLYSVQYLYTKALLVNKKSI